MTQQTAVEWYVDTINESCRRHGIYFQLPKDGIEFQQAKAMEKEQIKESFKDGVHEGVLTDINYLKCDNEAEYYYNETYKNY